MDILPAAKNVCTNRSHLPAGTEDITTTIYYHGVARSNTNTILFYLQFQDIFSNYVPKHMRIKRLTVYPRLKQNGQTK